MSEELPPLQKSRPDGQLYARRKSVVRQIVETLTLSFDELKTRATIRDANAKGYIPSEVLMYHLRATKSDNHDDRFAALFTIVRDRIEAACPRAEQRHAGEDIEIASLSEFRERVVEHVVTLVVMDRHDYQEKLDYFEVSFNQAIIFLRRTAFRKHYRTDRETDSLDEILEVANRVVDDGSDHPLEAQLSQAASHIHRNDIRRAIDGLSPKQRQVIEMTAMGYQTTSSDPDEPTITSTLGLSEETVRYHRRNARKRLHETLDLDLSDVA